MLPMASTAFDDADRPAPAPAPNAGGRPWLLIAVVAVLSVALAVTGTLLFVSGGKADAKDPAAAAAAADDCHPKPGADAAKTPLYLEVTPPFVVNLNEADAVHFLQVEVSLMAYDQPTLDKAREQLPLIRHHLVLLFGDQTFADIRTQEGKVKLQGAAREIVRAALTKAVGAPLIEDLYLTSVVGQ